MGGIKKMIKKLTIMVMALILVCSSVFATVTNPSPALDVMTNSATYNFSVNTTRASAFLNFEGVLFEMVGGPGGVGLNNFLLPTDGIYQFFFVDIDGQTVINDLTIDRINPSTSNFGFNALNYVVDYASDCSDLYLASSSGQFSTNGGGSWTSFNTSQDLNTTFGVGPQNVLFRGVCTDQAGNTAVTSNTQILLPSTPAVLLSIERLSPSPIGFVSSPVSVDGLGSLVNVMLKLVYDKLVSINVDVNGTNGSDPFVAVDHIINLPQLGTGSYNIAVTSDDGIGNTATDIIVLNVVNAGSTGGNVQLNVRGPVIVDPDSFTTTDNGTVVRNNILPGDFFIVEWTVQTTNLPFTRGIFNSVDVGFGTPVTVFCGEDYDSVTKNIVVSPARNVLNSVSGTWANVELQQALNCADTDGIVDNHYTYKVYMKIPTLMSVAAPSILNAQLELGGYYTVI